MLDVTSNGYFVYAADVPLSVIEIRQKFSMNEVCNFIKTVSECAEVFSSQEAEALYYERYFAKNLFWFVIDKNNAYGDDGERLYCIPKGFNRRVWTKQNLEYKSHIMPDNEAIKQQLKNINRTEYKRLSNISILSFAP